MSALAELMPQVAVDIRGNTVLLELICTDGLASRVLFEDILEKLSSDGGLNLQLRGKPIAEGAGSA